MTNKPHLSLHPLLAIAIVLAALGISACGGGGTTTVTVTVPAAETKPPAEKSAKNGGEKAEIGEAGVVAGYVDNVAAESETVKLVGWAASPDLAGPASKVTATVAGKKLAEAVPTIERQDVVEALGKPGLKDSGFELSLPMADLECGAPAAGIKVIGELEGRSGPLEFGEGIKAKLGETC